jgi:predicted MFS family arabinose efflux permease
LEFIRTQGIAMSGLVLSRQSIAAAVITSGGAIIVLGVMPIIASLFVARFGLGLDQVGWVLSTESFGIATGTALSYLLIPRGNWRVCVAGAATLSVVANLATAFVPGFEALLTLRFCAGAGAGVAYSVAIFLLGHSRHPERAFAGAVVTQGLFFALYAEALPRLNDAFGAQAAIGSIAGWFALIMLLSTLLPRPPRGADTLAATQTENASHADASASPQRGALALAGLLFFQIAIFAFWPFADQLGLARGLDADTVGEAISASLIVGIFAGLVPIFAGERLGRGRMASLACLSVVAAMVLLAEFDGARAYLAGLVLFNVGWPLGVTYFMALTTHHDTGHHGWFARSIPLAQVASGILGPAIVAAIIGEGDVVTANWVSASFAMLALLAGWSIALPTRLSASQEGAR